MKTIILDEPGAFRLLDTAHPGQPGPGQALVRVKRVGICGTDLHAFRGRQPFFSYPRILGHELGVEVVALGENAVTSVAPGDTCALEPYLTCGVCSACRRGRTNCCDSMQVLGVQTDGGMREEILVPAQKLIKADGVPVDHLATVEMLCIGAHAVRRADLAPNESVLVIGAGPIGLGVMQFAQLAGADVVGMEVSEGRMAFAAEQLGVTRWVNGLEDAIPQMHRHFGGELPITVFDATGNANSMMQAFRYIANGGKLVLVGLVQADITFSDPEFHRRETTLLSSRNASAEDFANVIAAMQAGRINMDPWITHRASPEEMLTEFPNWLEPDYGVVKAMLEFA